MLAAAAATCEPAPLRSSSSPPQLLQYGANIHHVNSKADGGSALHEAVAHKHEAVVELLLAHGGNPFVENIKVGGGQRTMVGPMVGPIASSPGREWGGLEVKRHPALL